MKVIAQPSKLLKFYHIPNVNPSDIGFVWLDVQCLHEPKLSKKAIDYQHRDIRDWLYANMDLNAKEPTGFEIQEDSILVRNGSKKRYVIRCEEAKVREENEDEQ